MATAPQMGPPPGWYPDPDPHQVNVLRYWNGQSWTEDRLEKTALVTWPRRLVRRWVVVGFGVSLIAWLPGIYFQEERAVLLTPVPLLVALVLAMIPGTRSLGLSLAVGWATWSVVLLIVIPLTVMIFLVVSGGEM